MRAAVAFINNLHLAIQYNGVIKEMSELLRILNSTNKESKQRQVARMKNQVAYLNQEIQLIEMTLDTEEPRKKQH